MGTGLRVKLRRGTRFENLDLVLDTSDGELREFIEAKMRAGDADLLGHLFARLCAHIRHQRTAKRGPRGLLRHLKRGFGERQGEHLFDQLLQDKLRLDWLNRIGAPAEIRGAVRQAIDDAMHRGSPWPPETSP